MTLQEAINSGKAFARAEDADMGDYVTANEYLANGISLEDYNATDYELEPDDSIPEVTIETLSRAWDAAKGSSRAIAIASNSEMFKRFTEQLKTLGVNVR